jgi:hypothetical protein
LLGRLLLGDDACATLDGAPCAIAIAPHGYAEIPSPLDAIGVGYDGSSESEHALLTARELANRAGARMRGRLVDGGRVTVSHRARRMSSAGAGTDGGGDRFGSPCGVVWGRRQRPDTSAVSTDQDDQLLRMPLPVPPPTLEL